MFDMEGVTEAFEDIVHQIRGYVQQYTSQEEIQG